MLMASVPPATSDWEDTDDQVPLIEHIPHITEHEHDVSDYEEQELSIIRRCDQ
jgi:hypothetical protein